MQIRNLVVYSLNITKTMGSVRLGSSYLTWDKKDKSHVTAWVSIESGLKE